MLLTCSVDAQPKTIRFVSFEQLVCRTMSSCWCAREIVVDEDNQKNGACHQCYISYITHGKRNVPIDTIQQHLPVLHGTRPTPQGHSLETGMPMLFDTSFLVPVQYIRFTFLQWTIIPSFLSLTHGHSKSETKFDSHVNIVCTALRLALLRYDKISPMKSVLRFVSRCRRPEDSIWGWHSRKGRLRYEEDNGRTCHQMTRSQMLRGLIEWSMKHTRRTHDRVDQREPLEPRAFRRLLLVGGVGRTGERPFYIRNSNGEHCSSFYVLILTFSRWRFDGCRCSSWRSGSSGGGLDGSRYSSGGLGGSRCSGYRSGDGYLLGTLGAQDDADEHEGNGLVVAHHFCSSVSSQPVRMTTKQRVHSVSAMSECVLCKF